MSSNFKTRLYSDETSLHVKKWILIQSKLGRATATIDAYGRAILAYADFCSNNGIEHEHAQREHLVNYIHYLANKPITLKNSKIQHGLANATIQQHIVAIRLYYDFLKEEGIRKDNLITRGKYTKHQGFGVSRRGLLPHYKKLPWIPNEEQWFAILNEIKNDSVRNRLMLSLAYDAGLRREELCSIEIGDIDPSQRLITLRAETTKTKRARVIPFTAVTGRLLALYTRERRAISKDYGLLFLSQSRRNYGKSITLSTWSKIIYQLAQKTNLIKLSTHTLRHLCLTDLARTGLDIHEIATFAGHASIDTTMQYIHLSGRDLTARLAKTIDSVRDQRIQVIKNTIV